MAKSKKNLKNPQCPVKQYKRYKYLGKKVADVGGCGLDSAREFYGIIKAILEDYEKGRIKPSTARGRLLNLYRLSFPEKNSKIRHLSKRTIENIRKRIREAMRKIKGR